MTGLIWLKLLLYFRSRFPLFYNRINFQILFKTLSKGSLWCRWKPFSWAVCETHSIDVCLWIKRGSFFFFLRAFSTNPFLYVWSKVFILLKFMKESNSLLRLRRLKDLSWLLFWLYLLWMVLFRMARLHNLFKVLLIVRFLVLAKELDRLRLSLDGFNLRSNLFLRERNLTWEAFLREILF